MIAVDNNNIESIVLRLMEDEEITLQESLVLKQWIKEHPQESEELYSISLLWTKLDTYREVSDDIVFNKWTETNKKNKIPKKRIRIVLSSYQKYAAIFILGALLPSLAIIYQNFIKDEKLLSQVIQVPFGAKSTVTLPDGTEVILNAGSMISYDSHYGKNQRSVFLNGEAYFKVTKDKHTPFLVKTADITVKAYGTMFNVKCYKGENITETTLIEGSVGVRLNRKKGNKEYMLKPNEQLIYHYGTDKKSNRLIIAKNVNTQLYTSWINDKIQVRSISLKELTVKLQRKYNVTIHIEDKDLESLKFTGILENETIEQILQALELSASIQYEINDREIWLYKKK